MNSFILPPVTIKGVVIPLWAAKACAEDLKGMGLDVSATHSMPDNRVVVYCEELTMVFRVFEDEDDGQVRVEDMLIAPPMKEFGPQVPPPLIG